MPEETPKESTTFNTTMKVALGVAIVATAAYIFKRMQKKAESEKRIARMEAMLAALEKEYMEQKVQDAHSCPTPDTH